jgi:hypothetical protein
VFDFLGYQVTLLLIMAQNKKLAVNFESDTNAKARIMLFLGSP